MPLPLPPPPLPPPGTTAPWQTRIASFKLPERLEIVTEPNEVPLRVSRCHLAITAGNNTAIGTSLDALDRAFNRALQAQGRIGVDERSVDDTAARL